MRSYFLLIGLFLGFFSMLAGEIIQTASLDPLKEAIRTASCTTLVCFDIDDVLIVPKDRILRSSQRGRFEGFTSQLASRVSEEEFQKLISLIWMQHEVRLVDPKILEIVAELEAKNIKTLAVTNTESGSFGHIPKIEEWNAKRLQKFGIDFRWSFPEVEWISFKTMTSKYPNRFPVYGEGVIHTCSVPKGKVVGAFLEKIDFHPSQIIFVDDKKVNLETVDSFCKKAGISFLGIHYTAVESSPCEDFDDEVIACQMKSLEKEGIWLSSAQVYAIKESNP